LSNAKVISPTTYDKYRITRDHLAKYLKEERKLSDIPLKEINYEFITGFERFLHQPFQVEYPVPLILP
jgi:hypothetical protein